MKDVGALTLAVVFFQSYTLLDCGILCIAYSVNDKEMSNGDLNEEGYVKESSQGLLCESFIMHISVSTM